MLKGNSKRTIVERNKIVRKFWKLYLDFKNKISYYRYVLEGRLLGYDPHTTEYGKDREKVSCDFLGENKEVAYCYYKGIPEI